MSAVVQMVDEELHAPKSDSESSEELEARRIRCIPSRSRKRNGSHYTRSVASSSPPKRPQSARLRNGGYKSRPLSPVGSRSPPKPNDIVTVPTSRHRRARSWVPPWNGRREPGPATVDDHGIAELVTDESDAPEVNGTDRAQKHKKGWSTYLGWSRNRDNSTAVLATEEDEDARDQAGAVGEGSPVNAPTHEGKGKEKRGKSTSKYLWPFSSKPGESKNSALDGGASESDTVGGGDGSADENTVESSRPSSRHNVYASSSKDGKEDKDEKEEKGKDKKAAKHRRGGSIMDLFKFKSTEGTGDGVEDSSGKAAGKKGDSSQAGYRASSLSCFGMPNVVDDDEAVVEIIIEGLTSGRAGMRNLGNTCFINSALQCLRATPLLLENIAHELMQDPSLLPQNLMSSEVDPPLPQQSPTSVGPGSNCAMDGASASPNSVVINASHPASPLATSTSAANIGLSTSAAKPRENSNAAASSGAVSPSAVQLAFAANANSSSSRDASGGVPASSPSAAAGSSGGLASRIDAAVAKYDSRPGSVASSPMKTHHSSPRGTQVTPSQSCPTSLDAQEPSAGSGAAMPPLPGSRSGSDSRLRDHRTASASERTGSESRTAASAAQSTAVAAGPTIIASGPVSEGVSQSSSHRVATGAVPASSGAVKAPAVATDPQLSGQGAVEGVLHSQVAAEADVVPATQDTTLCTDSSLNGVTDKLAAVSLADQGQIDSETGQEGGDSAPPEQDLASAGKLDIDESGREQTESGDGDHGGQDNEAEAKTTAPEVSNAELAKDIVHAMVRVATGEEGEVMVPQKFHQDMANNSMGSLFSDGGQHDSHEFLRYVMNVLHEAYDRVKEKPPYEEFVELEDEEPADKADRLWQVQQSREASPLSDTFQGQLESCVVCTKCQSTFYTYEPFMDLSLSLNKEGKGFSSLFKGKTIDKLEDCFHAFTEDEKLDGNEAFWCSVCEARTTATKVLRIHRFPRALVLHIKRFKMAARQHVKLSSNVAIPLQGLDLAPFASESASLEEEGAMYDLYALANHSGSVDSGHYTAHAKVLTPENTENTQPWYLFADDRVHEVEADDVVSSEAYMMFFVRRPRMPMSPDAA